MFAVDENKDSVFTYEAEVVSGEVSIAAFQQACWDVILNFDEGAAVIKKIEEYSPYTKTVLSLNFSELSKEVWNVHFTVEGITPSVRPLFSVSCCRKKLAQLFWEMREELGKIPLKLAHIKILSKATLDEKSKAELCKRVDDWSAKVSHCFMALVNGKRGFLTSPTEAESNSDSVYCYRAEIEKGIIHSMSIMKSDWSVGLYFDDEKASVFLQTTESIAPKSGGNFVLKEIESNVWGIIPILSMSAVMFDPVLQVPSTRKQMAHLFWNLREELAAVADQALELECELSKHNYKKTMPPVKEKVSQWHELTKKALMELVATKYGICAKPR